MRNIVLTFLFIFIISGISWKDKTYGVTSVSVVTSNGISGTVQNATSTAAITISVGSGAITNTQLAGSIDLATKVTGILPFASKAGSSATTSASTGVMTVSMVTPLITITPTNACTFNGSGGAVGQQVTFVITTSGSSSFVLTWGTNFRSTGTLATGVTTAKVFCVTFICTATNQWTEISRTAAQ